MKKIAACSALLVALSAVASCAVGDETGTETDETGTAEMAEEATALQQEVGTQATTGSYSYSASDTNSAQQNTINRSISLVAGQKITLGTCDVAGATYTGDTYLRLLGPSSLEVAYSDDACGGTGSNLSYVATTTGSYQIRGGCYGSSACTGTVAWSVNGTGNGPPSSGSYNYATTNTNSAQQNTIDRAITANAGQRVSVKICTNITGDPYLRINNPDGTLLAYNDDSCAAQGAQFTWTATTTGSYTIRAGCFSSTACNATVTWTIE